MVMTKIDKIWSDLESDSSFTSGLLYKRYSATIYLDVFVALRVPERLRCIAFKVSIDFDFGFSNKLKDIKLEIFPDQSDKSKKFILVLLLNQDHLDIFSTLCEDLITGISEVTRENDLVSALVDRLVKWESLFEKVGKQGLSNETQRGLFGELFFLRLLLNHSSDYLYCVNTWLGPEKGVQDFQFSNWAVEVKTTHGKNHQKVFISSERQLDDTLVEKIFLFHLSLDERKEHGETLNELVDSILGLLKDHRVAFNKFQLKLFEYGFLDLHRYVYDLNGYLIRQQNIFRVGGKFPRIIESQIPKGVGDLKYSIILPESDEWNVSQDLMFNEIFL